MRRSSGSSVPRSSSAKPEEPTRFLLRKVVLILALTLPLLAQVEDRRSRLSGQAGLPVLQAVVEGAKRQVGKTRSYDPAYRRIAYPGGDVPLETGVCTDVVIRAYRHAGVDLQVLVHQDMKANFSAYPRNWGLRRPDTNIDHRRVPNLATFFRRKGASLPVTNRAADYKPGDIVTWRLSSGVPHIGIVSDVKRPFLTRPLVVHNIGSGAQEEDVLFAYEVTAHYRYVTPR